MRVHPAPAFRKRSIAAAPGREKRLRRLPHIFSKVLELPLSADADVTVQETPDSFQFAVAALDVIEGDVRAHAIEIYPGVMKVVIRDGSADPEASEEEEEGIEGLELDRWRFRLPPCSRPQLATAGYVNGELVVTVPKGVGSDDVEELDGGDLVDGVIGRLVAVQ